MNLVILKIGGSIITYKERVKPAVNFRNLRKIVDQLVGIKKKFILIHGAGSFGHQIVKKTGIYTGIKKERDLLSFAETQRLQNKLNIIVTKELIKRGLPAFPFQVSSSAVTKKGKLIKMDLDVLKGLLKINMIPVLYGVPAYDTKKGCSILSGDQTARFLAEKLKASKIIMASNVDGIFSSDPASNKNAIHIDLVNRKNFKQVGKMLSGSPHADVTGGMAGKVYELLQTAKKGIPAQIIDGTKKDNIRQALLGKKVGTMIIW